MILILAALVGLLVVPIVLSHRARIATWPARTVALGWILAAAPPVVLLWMMSRDIGRDWALSLPGGEWVALVLFNLVLLALLVSVIGLPAAVLTATAIWLRAWQARHAAAGRERTDRSG